MVKARSLRAARPRSATFVTPLPSSARSPRPRCRRRRRAPPGRRAAPRGGRRRTAASGSCVTITTVWPNSSTAVRSRPSTSSLDFESRLPVGSSANTTAGRDTSARATATRCCWPPDSSAGRCVSRSPSPTVSISRSNHSRVRPPPRDRQRQQHVLLGRQHRDQVEELEDEAELVAPQPRELGVVEAGDLLAVERHGAATWAGRARRGCASAWTCQTRTGP